MSDLELGALITACQGKEFADRRDEAMVWLFVDTGTGLGQAQATAPDVADVELASDEGHDVDAPGEDVTAGAKEVARGVCGW